MKIVIVGAGKLGYSIAELLAQEDHEVTVTDSDKEQLVEVENTLDALTIFHDGGIISLFDDPNIQSADMLIAVTGADETNAALCALAKSYGIQNTVARVREEITDEQKRHLMETLKIDLVLNPELLAAREIHRVLMTPDALNIAEFAHGKIRLFETKITKRSKVLGKTLKEVELPQGVLAGMIFRGQRMIIPHGDYSFGLHDNAYFIGIPEEIEKFSKSFTEQKAKHIERAMIIGAGRAGRLLAKMLDLSGVRVKLIDTDESRLQMISADFKNSLAILGDGANIDLLIEEEAASADTFIAITDDDKQNLILALLAKHLNVPHTVVRVYRTEYEALMEKVGVNYAVSARHLAASEVMTFARQGAVKKVSYLEGARAEAVEIIVAEGAKVAGIPLMKAALPRECLVCAFVRKNEAHIPRGNTILEAGDRVIVFLESGASNKVMEYFK